MKINSNSDKALGARRSPKWRSFRNKFLEGKKCAVCGGKTKLEAHHIEPFISAPERELDPSNILPLCEGRKQINCHCCIGHGGDYRDYNPFSEELAQLLNWLMKNRQAIKVDGIWEEKDKYRGIKEELAFIVRKLVKK